MWLAEILQTERLILREPRESDARAIFDTYTQDPQVARYMIWRPHRSVLETEEFIAGCMKDWPGSFRRSYVLEYRSSPGQPIGMIDARRHSHVIDVGYVLARAHWGQGLMPEAVRALAEASLAIADCFRVQATCDAENRPSARTLEKAGFARDGRFERYMIHPNISTEPRACYVYSLCR